MPLSSFPYNHYRSIIITLAPFHHREVNKTSVLSFGCFFFFVSQRHQENVSETSASFLLRRFGHDYCSKMLF